MLGALLLVGQQLGGDPLVLLEVAAARARAGDRAGRHVVAGDGEQRLGRRAGDLEVAEVEVVHVRRRVDRPQPAVDRERLLVDRGAPALRRDDLEGVAGVDVLDDPRDVALELGALHVRLPVRLGPGAGHAARRRDRPGERRADLVDHRRVPHRDDGDRVLEVVEGDERVGEHERHVGQAHRVGVGRAERLDRAHEVVAEVADRAAGERRQVRVAGQARAPDLLGGERVRVAGVAERPAQHVAGPEADERPAPDPLALLGGLQQERGAGGIGFAQLQERRDRRLAVGDERVGDRLALSDGGH